MAVNGKSEPEAIDFFRSHNAATFFQIKANQAHALLVQQLAELYPQVHLVDTHPDLDGNYQKFLDLVHFTQEGDRQLAETFFASLRKLLETKLVSPAKTQLNESKNGPIHESRSGKGWFDKDNQVEGTSPLAKPIASSNLSVPPSPD